MTMLFDAKRFEIQEFYSYPCTVCDRIVEYEERGIGGTRGDEDVKDFFNECLEETQKKANKKHLMDNKIAMRIKDNETGNILYVGYKDNIYCIGNCLNPYMKSAYTIKF